MVVFIINIPDVFAFDLNVIRQLPLTSLTSFFAGAGHACKSRPGKAISLGFIETFSRPRISRKRSACLAWTPDLIPL